VPRYTPPPGLTPAAARYLQLNGTDGRSLAALLVDLALRKRITIEPQDGKYRVRFVNSPVPLDTLPPEEKIAMELLLAWNTPTTAMVRWYFSLCGFCSPISFWESSSRPGWSLRSRAHTASGWQPKI